MRKFSLPQNRIRSITAYCFKTDEMLFECAELLYKLPNINLLGSRLYKCDNLYWLIISVNKSLKAKIRQGLKPYFSPTELSLARIAYLNEHGKIICKNRAVNKIGKSIFKDS